MKICPVVMQRAPSGNGSGWILCDWFGVTCWDYGLGVEMITYGQGISQACPG